MQEQKIPTNRRIEMENKCFPRKRGKRDHLEVTREVKYILKVSKQINLEGQGKNRLPTIIQ
jgi:hypothetical protein